MTIRTWAIGGDAIDDEFTARTLAHFAVGGKTGVLGVNDCRGLPLSTPGAGFRVVVGGVSVAVPTLPRQKYLSDIGSDEIVTGVTGTDASGPRHDLVGVRTNNPNLPGGGQPPADPQLGPYTVVYILQGVPFYTPSFASLGLLLPAEELFRIEWPASCATIGGGTGNAKIVDLRLDDGTAQGVTPGKDPVSTPPPAANTDFDDLREGTYNVASAMPTAMGNWPTTGISPTFAVSFPSWARRCYAEFRVENVLSTGLAGGSTQLVIGDGTLTTPAKGFLYNSISTQTVAHAALFTVPDSLRGKTVNVTLQAAKTAGAGGVSFAGGASYLIPRLRFKP